MGEIVSIALKTKPDTIPISIYPAAAANKLLAVTFVWYASIFTSLKIPHHTKILQIMTTGIPLYANSIGVNDHKQMEAIAKMPRFRNLISFNPFLSAVLVAFTIITASNV